MVTQSRTGAVGSWATYPLGMRLANAIVSYAAYLGHALWPVGLAAFYPYPAEIPAWHVGVGLATLFGTTALVVRLAHRRPYLFTGWLWYLITLLPVIGLVQVGEQAMADRYTYIPFIGLAIMAVWGVGDLIPAAVPPLAVSSIAGAVVLLYAGVSWVQVHYWHDTVTLFRRVLAVTPESPNNYSAHANLGAGLMRQGHYTEGLEQYQRGLALRPRYARAHLNVGLAHAALGDTTQALADYRAALALDARDWFILASLAGLLARQGEWTAAAQHYTAALRLNPGNAQLHRWLAAVQAQAARQTSAGPLQ